MKFKFCFLLMVPALLTGITPMVAEPAPGIVATNNPGTLPNTAISFDQIGAMAGKQCSGDGLAVAACSEGASLRCVFQRLNAKATTQGLWLMSTKDRANGETIRVVARAVGRTKTEPLAASGKVKVKGQVARFFRPGLMEEYSVSIDGLQQDFVIKQRPAGNGPMRLELEVDGARVGRTAYGAQLVLANSGRRIAYSRLRALDAKGKALPARMEVVYKSEIGNRKSEMNLAVVLDDVGAEYPVRIDPTFSDANWISLGGIAGTDGYVSAAAVDASGNLFIGGWFAVAGNVSANNIARWDGSSWSTLASGMNGEVDALAMSGTNLFAGGYFTTAGGVSANNIAQWNGNRWAALGSGMNGPVGALAVSGTNLYAASGFSIAQWNGSSWSALGAGMAGGDANGPSVYALTISGNTLYAGGDFGTAGGVSAN